MDFGGQNYDVRDGRSYAIAIANATSGKHKRQPKNQKTHEILLQEWTKCCQDSKSACSGNLADMDIIDKIPDQGGPRRKTSVVSVVIHATGDTDLEKVLAFYANNRRLVRPHYLLDLGGTVYQFTPEDRVAYHAGYQGDGPDNEGVLYRAGWEVWSRRIRKAPWIVQEPFEGYAWWRSRWPNLESPTGRWEAGTQVSPGLLAGANPNGATVGIECLSPKHRVPEVFTGAQYAVLPKLVVEICGRHDLPVDKDHVVGHQDLNPIGRSDLSGGWDPGVGFDWARVLG